MYNGLYPPPLWTSNQNNLINNNDKKKQSSGFSIKSGNKYFFDMNNIILNEEDSQIKNEENKNDDNKNKENKEDNNIEEKDEKNLKIKLKPNFYLDYDNKIKCSCFRTQCDKLYFRTKRYCVNCNCKNCLNKPQNNSNSNIKIENKSSINEKNKTIFCTCTKSGCKLKYCECVKFGRECTQMQKFKKAKY